jgi:multidrug efflux pump subunit AcrB
MIRKQLVVLFLAASVVALGGCARQTAGKPLPSVTVTAIYPGANAQVVQDTVAAPIEQQVLGVEGMVHLWSRCTDDGRYTLTVTFKPGTDLNVAQVLVQNREALAEPILPDLVKRRGLSVKKDSPGALLLVSLFSPGGSRDTLHLSNYAGVQIKDELARVPGVWGVVLFGQREQAMRVWLDPQKLAARGLTAQDVVGALQAQNAQVAAGEIGRPANGGGKAASLVVNTLGRLVDAGQLEDVVVKAGDADQVVRLKDVGRVELGVAEGGRVTLDGKPCVALGVYPAGPARPQDISTAVRERMASLRERFPEGIDCHVGFDFTPNLEAPGRSTDPEYFLVDVSLPASASPQRTDDVLRRCATELQKVAGVEHTLTLTDNPLDQVTDRPCVLVQLAPAARRQASREQIIADVRTRLEKETPEAVLRLRDLSAPGVLPRCGYPIDLAVSGPQAEEVRKLADTLAERLRQTGQLTDVWANTDSVPRPQLELVLDREQAHDRGVSLQDVLGTLESAVGAVEANDFNRPGRAWQVRVRLADDAGGRLENLKLLKVRNAKGDLVPLGDVAAVRDIMAPAILNRLDGRPIVEVTANRAPGLSAAQARVLCEKLVAELREKLGLSDDYRLTWADGTQATK